MQNNINLNYLTFAQSLIGTEYGQPILPEWIDREYFFAIIKSLKENKIDHKPLETYYKLNINYLSNRFELISNF